MKAETEHQKKNYCTQQWFHRGDYQVNKGHYCKLRRGHVMAPIHLSKQRAVFVTGIH